MFRGDWLRRFNFLLLLFSYLFWGTLGHCDDLLLLLRIEYIVRVCPNASPILDSTVRVVLLSRLIIPTFAIIFHSRILLWSLGNVIVILVFNRRIRLFLCLLLCEHVLDLLLPLRNFFLLLVDFVTLILHNFS